MFFRCTIRVLIVTNGWFRSLTSFFNLCQIIAEFINVTCNHQFRNFNNWRFVWYFMYRQTINVRLNVFAIIELGYTRKLIVVNLRKSIHKAVCCGFDFVTCFIDKTRYQKFWYINLRRIARNLMFYYFVNMSLNCSIVSRFCTTSEFVSVTNHGWCRHEPLFSILDFTTFFIDVTCHIKCRNFNRWCFIWHFSFNQFVVVGMNAILMSTTTRILVVTNHRTFTNNTAFNWCDILSIFCHKACDLKFFWEAFRCIVWHFMFNHFVNMGLNRSVFSAFRTSSELIVVTNHRRSRDEPRFSILDFSSFFIHVTCYV